MNKISVTSKEVFGSLDFRALSDPDFKEDSVREIVILPLLRELGYESDDIERSVSLAHPFLRVGSRNRPVTLIPDYVLKSNGTRAWVLDAKSPRESVTSSEHIGQAFSYAIHPEINANFFALCNGLQLAIYSTRGDRNALLIVALDEIEHYWSGLKRLVSRDSFHNGKEFKYDGPKYNIDFDYTESPLIA